MIEHTKDEYKTKEQTISFLFHSIYMSILFCHFESFHFQLTVKLIVLLSHIHSLLNLKPKCRKYSKNKFHSTVPALLEGIVCTHNKIYSLKPAWQAMESSLQPNYPSLRTDVHAAHYMTHSTKAYFVFKMGTLNKLVDQ